MKTIETWLPVFTGFYGTIWEPSEDNEIEYINEQREAKGYSPITYDECQFDYREYENDVAKRVANIIGNTLKTEGFIRSLKFQKVRSPKEYNFRNDAIDIEIVLTGANKKKIMATLKENREAFELYLKETYTSRSGFISFYPNNIDAFMVDNPLEHDHKLGSILQFICDLLEVDEMDMYDNVQGNVSLSATNYYELTENEVIE